MDVHKQAISALWKALVNKDMETLRTVLIDDAIRRHQDPAGLTALNYAATYSWPQGLEWLAQQGIPDVPGRDGATALIRACMKGYSDSITPLLDKCNSDARHETPAGLTPLVAAVVAWWDAGGQVNLETIRRLRDAGATLDQGLRQKGAGTVLKKVATLGVDTQNIRWREVSDLF